MGKLFEKYIPKDKLEEISASEMRNIGKEEDYFYMLSGLSFIVGFVFLISLVALILWLNKFTLFISIVLLLTIMMLVLFAYVQFKTYTNLIKKVNERLGSLESK